jgi:hypothetical protein
MFSPVLENLGLHHRWNMFAHSPDDTSHFWNNSEYRIVVRDKQGIEERFPFYRRDGFMERYLSYREFRFKNVFWSLRSVYGPSLGRYWANEFYARHPQAVFPLNVSVEVGWRNVLPFGGEQIEGPLQSAIAYSGIYDAAALRCDRQAREGFK